jgi:hypothetical protein
MINNRFNVFYHLLCVSKIKIIQIKIMEEIKKLIGEVIPEISTGDVNYHHSVLIKLVKIINLQQEQLEQILKEKKDEN